jgi:RNA polymerase-binding transcription factor DksA
MNCRCCNNQIEPERFEILPNTLFCSKCAHQHNFIKPRKGVLVFTHKTGGELQTMSADYFEKNKQYFIPQNGSGRSVMKNFSRNIDV